MSASKKVQVRIHDSAAAEWKQFLADLPGKDEDKILLVRTYVMDWVQRILPKLREGTKLSWECPFRDSHSFYFALTDASDSTSVYITGVKPTG